MPANKLTFTQFLKDGITNPALLNDFRMFESKAFKRALNTYHGPLTEGDVTDNIARDYHLIKDLLDLLDGMGHSGINGLSDILSRHVPKARRAAGWHHLDHKRPPAAVWGPLVYASVLFQICVAVKGVDPGFGLATVPAIERAFGIYYDRGTHPTANWKGIYEMNEQRFIRLLPSLAVYAATMNPANADFYGTKLYFGLSVGLSVPVLAAIMARREWDGFKGRKDVKRTVEALQAAEDAGADDITRITAHLNATADALANWQRLTRSLRQKFKIGHASEDAYTEMMREVTTILQAIRTTANREILVPDNPEAEEKWGAFVLADILVGFSIGCTKGNPAALLGVVIWGTWLLQRIWDYAKDGDQSAENTLKFLSQAGMSLIFTVFTVYIPLLAFGPHVFDTHEWPFWTSLSIQLVLTGLYGHLIGPYLNDSAIMPAMPFLGKYGIRPVRYCVGKTKEYAGKTKIVLMRRRVARTDEENTAGELALPNVTEDEILKQVLSPAEARRAAELGRELTTVDDVQIRRRRKEDSSSEIPTIEDLVKGFFSDDVDASSWQDPTDERDLGLLDADHSHAHRDTSNPLDRAFERLAESLPSFGENNDGENLSAKFVDLMSALDIAEDTGKLTNKEGGDEFDRVRSFLLNMFSDEKGKALLRTIGFLFSGASD